MDAQTQKITRRRFLTVCAMAGAYAAMPWARALASVPVHRWRGVLLGAEVNLSLAHPSRAQAERIFDVCVQEIRRLEQIFTLYDSYSELSRLNAAGRLEDPSAEFVDILEQAQYYHKLTGGAFDVSVGGFERGRDAFGMEHVDVSPRMISFAKPGLRLTLNGVAQGYITDRITDLLRDEGLSNVLVELGETRAIGRHPSGRDWQIALTDRQEIAPLNDMALASSSSMNGDTGRPHIYDARERQLVQQARAVSVVAETAALADAMSTAFIGMSGAEIVAVQRKEPRIRKVYS